MEGALSRESIVLAINQVADSVLITDLKGTILYVNAAFTVMTGYQRQEAVGRRSNLLKSGEQNPEIYRQLWATILSGNVWRGTLINRRKDGSHYHEEMTITPSRDASGVAVRFIAIKRDITARLEAELDQMRYKTIFEASRDALLIADSSTGMLLDANPAAVALLGRPLAEIRKMHQSELHADPEAGRASFQRRRLNPGISVHGIRRGDGATVPVEISAGPIRDVRGRDLVLGIFHDLTERYQAEEELRRSEEKFRQLAENINEVFWILDASDLSVLYLSSAAERLWGRSREELMQKSLYLEAIDPDDLERILAAFRTVLAGSNAETEFRIRTPRGETKWVRNRAFPVYDSGAVVRVVGVAEDVSARKKAEIRLAYQARHDHLTGLPNRLRISEELESAIKDSSANGLMLAVIYIDLDRFKFANDTLGHETGDALLQRVTRRIKSRVRASDVLARMGGDEFLAVVKNIRDEADVQTIAENLRLALCRPFRIAGREVFVTASLGIAMYPRDGLDSGVLRSNADEALYEAKRSGKDRICFYDSRMRRLFAERLRLDTELRRALEMGQLFLNFQPIFDVASGRQTAFEALLRWNHPEMGIVPPAKFIPQAEENGLIVPVGAWVMQEACRQCRSWQDRGFPGVRVAVNVSSVEFALPEFTGRVLQILRETGLSGDLLELELTESTFMGNAALLVERMGRLREKGIRVSIDDFGTGYSSLGYLPRLPVDGLKIDRAFVAALEHEGIARPLIQGIISLAHGIGKKVVVEGVETRGQLDILRSMDVDEVQGFLLGHPISPEHFTETVSGCVLGVRTTVKTLPPHVLAGLLPGPPADPMKTRSSMAHLPDCEMPSPRPGSQDAFTAGNPQLGSSSLNV